MGEHDDKVMHTLGKIEGKQDLILDYQKNQDKKIDANSKRLGVVEKRQSYISGGIAMAATVFGVVITKASEIFKLFT